MAGFRREWNPEENVERDREGRGRGRRSRAGNMAPRGQRGAGQLYGQEGTSGYYGQEGAYGSYGVEGASGYSEQGGASESYGEGGTSGSYGMGGASWSYEQGGMAGLRGAACFSGQGDIEEHSRQREAGYYRQGGAGSVGQIQSQDWFGQGRTDYSGEVGVSSLGQEGRNEPFELWGASGGLVGQEGSGCGSEGRDVFSGLSSGEEGQGNQSLVTYGATGGALSTPGGVGRNKGKQTRMYEVGPQVDPEMEKRRKDAAKAKRNREKKKQEEAEYKETLTSGTEEVRQLRQEVVERRRRCEELAENVHDLELRYQPPQ